MISSSGYYGCLKWQQEGEVFKYKKGNHHIFTFDKVNIDRPLRTKVNYEQDLASKDHGIKGDCVFNSLKYFNPVISINKDAMRSIFLGLIKILFVYWFEKSESNVDSLKDNLEVLNEKLLECKPPQFIQQPPRRIEEFHKWKAQEFMNWNSQYLFKLRSLICILVFANNQWIIKKIRLDFAMQKILLYQTI